MKGFILAAGLGTRLKPWTDHHPKALVEVGNKPMLERVVEKMHDAGIEDITINVHHFSSQIINFIRGKKWKVNISDETGQLLETGGGLLNAIQFLKGNEPVLVHNVDILSNADFLRLERDHFNNDADATLLVSDRKSSRKLIFDPHMSLIGWHSLNNEEYRPENFHPAETDLELAFSGIYIISPVLLSKMVLTGWAGKFSIMDYFLSTLHENRFKGYLQQDLDLIDIGKPDSLDRAMRLYDDKGNFI